MLLVLVVGARAYVVSQKYSSNTGSKKTDKRTKESRDNDVDKRYESDRTKQSRGINDRKDDYGGYDNDGSYYHEFDNNDYVLYDVEIFYCQDGEEIPLGYYNDGDCDCPDFEDEY